MGVVIAVGDMEAKEWMLTHSTAESRLLVDKIDEYELIDKNQDGQWNTINIFADLPIQYAL